MRRAQKEQAEKERLRIENEKRREKEEEEALEKARLVTNDSLNYLPVFGYDEHGSVIN